MSTTLRLTPDEYDRMIANGAFEGIDRRIELIRGELREMSPADPIHNDYIDFLNGWSHQVMARNECSVRVQSEIDLGHSRPEPDITWLKPKRYSSAHPQPDDVLLLIEVANSSITSDLEEKATLYAEANISEYWVVDVAAQEVHVFSQPSNGSYQSQQKHAGDASIVPICKPTVQLQLAELFL